MARQIKRSDDIYWSQKMEFVAQILQDVHLQLGVPAFTPFKKVIRLNHELQALSEMRCLPCFRLKGLKVDAYVDVLSELGCYI
jgi:hypothetical protein